jgi:hypothetical protein
MTGDVIELSLARIEDVLGREGPLGIPALAEKCRVDVATMRELMQRLYRAGRVRPAPVGGIAAWTPLSRQIARDGRAPAALGFQPDDPVQLYVSTRSFNCIRHQLGDGATLREVAELLSGQELLDQPGFGKLSLSELIAVLGQAGLRLRDHDATAGQAWDGIYALRLCCDRVNLAHGYREFPHRITGDSFEACAQAAEQLGWQLHRETCTATCPRCAGHTKKG